MSKRQEKRNNKIKKKQKTIKKNKKNKKVRNLGEWIGGCKNKEREKIKK